MSDVEEVHSADTVDVRVEPEPTGFRGSRAAWWVHLCFLGSYPVVMGLIAWQFGGNSETVALSPSVDQLLWVVGSELLIFGVWFGAAWYLSRATVDQLLLRGKHLFRAVGLGIFYSVALRVAVGIVVVGIVLFLSAGGERSASEVAEGLRPDVGKVVSTEKLGEDPVYLILNCTLVSFVLAGLREELWRAGVIGGFFVLFPRLDKSWGARLFTVFLVALLFGAGHAVQGPGGMVMTTLLGLGLGAIMVFHRSIWEAVLAHGFFNASTFLMLFVVKRYFADQLPDL